MSDQEILAEEIVPLSVDAAYVLFTAGLSRWWPPEFSWSGTEDLQDIGMEQRLDGVLYEIGPGGLRWDWGRVLAWQPPTRLVFSWQIGPDRVPVPRAEHATEVEVGFEPASNDETVVRVRHSRWDRHGEEGESYRTNFAAAWPMALARLVDVASEASQE